MQLKTILFVLAFVTFCIGLYCNVSFAWEVGGITLAVLIISEPVKLISVILLEQCIRHKVWVGIIPSLFFLIASLYSSQMAMIGYGTLYNAEQRQESVGANRLVKASEVSTENAKREMDALASYASLDVANIHNQIANAEKELKEWWNQVDGRTKLMYSQIMSTTCTPKYIDKFKGFMDSDASRLCADWKQFMAAHDVTALQAQIDGVHAYQLAAQAYENKLHEENAVRNTVVSTGATGLASAFDYAAMKFMTLTNTVRAWFGQDEKIGIEQIEAFSMFLFSAFLELIMLFFPYFLSKEGVFDVKFSTPKLPRLRKRPAQNVDDGGVVMPEQQEFVPEPDNAKHIPQKTDHPLCFLLGTDSDGNEVWPNLLQFPHMLIAGTSGEGKTRLEYHILNTFMKNASPNQLQWIGIDMKRGRALGIYENVPHLIKPLATDAESAMELLEWLKQEMDRRYTLIKKYPFTESVDDYNKQPGVEVLPYLILLVDETSELFEDAGKTAVQLISSFTRLAREAGIHLILCTQRPDKDSIPGQIKGNCGGRLAMYLPTQYDSVTILGHSGAEKLDQRHAVFSHKRLKTVLRLANVEKEDIRSTVELVTKKYKRPVVTSDTFAPQNVTIKSKSTTNVVTLSSVTRGAVTTHFPDVTRITDGVNALDLSRVTAGNSDMESDKNMAATQSKNVTSDNNIVRLVTMLHGQGYSLRSIANKLYENGVTNKAGDKLHPNQVKRILNKKR